MNIVCEIYINKYGNGKLRGVRKWYGKKNVGMGMMGPEMSTF